MAHRVNSVATHQPPAYTLSSYPARPVNAANAECEGRQHTHGSKRSYIHILLKRQGMHAKRDELQEVSALHLLCVICVQPKWSTKQSIQNALPSNV